MQNIKHNVGLGLLFLLILVGIAEAQVDCNSGGFSALQNAVNAASPGTTLTVTGACNGNLVIFNNVQRIVLQASGGASINGANTSPTISVRGKGIVINNFTITGGARGIHVQRNANATLNGNTISGATGDGVRVDDVAAAAFLNNIITGNGGNGIHITGNSAGRIGYQLDEDTAASPNTIQSNGGRGVLVSRNSHARIVGNTISSNGADGIWVTGSSQADIASNTINSNGSGGLGAGVFVNNGSNVILGHPTTATGEDFYSTAPAFLRDPNTTTANNVEAGVKCNRNSTIDGQRGTTQLNGTANGATFIDGSCEVQYL